MHVGADLRVCPFCGDRPAPFAIFRHDMCNMRRCVAGQTFPQMVDIIAKGQTRRSAPTGADMGMITYHRGDRILGVALHQKIFNVAFVYDFKRTVFVTR